MASPWGEEKCFSLWAVHPSVRSSSDLYQSKQDLGGRSCTWFKTFPCWLPLQSSLPHCTTHTGIFVWLVEWVANVSISSRWELYTVTFSSQAFIAVAALLSVWPSHWRLTVEPMPFVSAEWTSGEGFYFFFTKPELPVHLGSLKNIKWTAVTAGLMSLARWGGLTAFFSHVTFQTSSQMKKKICECYRDSCFYGVFGGWAGPGGFMWLYERLELVSANETTSHHIQWTDMSSRTMCSHWSPPLGNFGEQNVLYLFWVNAKHLKAFFHAWKRVKSPVSPFRRWSPAGLRPVAVVVSCLGPRMWELWALLSAPTLRLLLMTYFGKQKQNLSALTTRRRVTPPGCHGLGSVKTGRLITVFGSESNTAGLIVALRSIYSMYIYVYLVVSVSC